MSFIQIRTKVAFVIFVLLYAGFTTLSYEYLKLKNAESSQLVRHLLCGIESGAYTTNLTNGDTFHIFDAVEKSGELQVLGLHYGVNDSVLDWGSHYVLTRSFEKLQFRCRFHSTEKTKMFTTIARKEMDQYKFYFRLYCRIPYRELEITEFNEVTLYDKTGNINILLKLCNEELRKESKVKTVATCVSVLRDKFDESLIHQWVQYHKLIGIEHFYFFDRDGTYRSTIQKYVDEGVATYALQPLYRNDIQSSPSPDQILIFNKCLMRYGIRYEWMLFSDLDEYLNVRNDGHNITNYLMVFVDLYCFLI